MLVVSAFARPATGARAIAPVSIVDDRGKEIAAKQVSVVHHDRFEWIAEIVPITQGYIDFPLVMESLQKIKFQGRSVSTVNSIGCRLSR